jgi:hypothetical protein
VSGGNNHYSGCTCPWCYHPEFAVTTELPGFKPGGYESFTIPNAPCPKCGIPVFFYASPYGGKVYFDELGPPWPKHPCMDSSPIRLGRPRTDKTAPQWLTEGWEPVVFLSHTDGRDGRKVYARMKELKTGIIRDVWFKELKPSVDFVPCLMMRSPGGILVIRTPSETFTGNEIAFDPAAMRARLARLRHLK